MRGVGEALLATKVRSALDLATAAILDHTLGRWANRCCKVTFFYHDINAPPHNNIVIVFPYGEEIRCDQCYGMPGLQRKATYKNHADLTKILSACTRVRHGLACAAPVVMKKRI